MNHTKIEWCDFSANPLKYRTADGRVVWACEKLSPGCKHCYANGLADRYTDRRAGDWNAATMATLTPFLDERELQRMLTYKPAAGKRCFVGDMTDMFGEWVPDELLDQLFAVFAIRSDVTWQILTKRATRLRHYFRGSIRNEQVANVCGWQYARGDVGRALIGQDGSGRACVARWPLPNVWLGVSCENQEFANQRIPFLLQTPAAVRFISAEPLLGPINLTGIRWETEGSGGPAFVDVAGGTFSTLGGHGLPGPKLDWVIVGGESGAGARPCDLSWIRSLVGQCRAGLVPVFVKQVGSRPFDYIDPNPHTGYKGHLRVFRNNLDVMEQISQHEGRLPNTIANREIRNRKGGAIEEWPEDLRIREFPGAVAVVHG